MSSMNQNMLPSLYSLSQKVALETYARLLCKLLFMGPKLTAELNQKYILGNPKQGFRSVRRCVGKNKIPISASKEVFKSKRLNTHARKETDELCPMQLTYINAKSGDVVTSFDLKPYRKHLAKKKCESEKFQLRKILVKILPGIFDFSFLRLSILIAFFQQLHMYMPRRLLEKFCEQLQREISQFAMKLLIINLVSISSKSKYLAPIHFPSKAKTIEFDENSAKPAEKAIFSTSITAETQTAVDLPEEISAKPVQSCRVCSEPIWKKKFFDERRFGILEKCKCVICYGCLRILTRTTDRVVKGPVECPTCTTVSDNVASSSSWVKDEDKEQFFKDYCKNVQNTGIKMRLGWTSFPARKENVWTRVL